jgi:hypothetical protein
MDDASALRLAIDLLSVPSRVRLARSNPLPPGVPFLLEIAAGEESARSAAAELTSRSTRVVTDAATFFIEQILLAPEADSYRVLGATRTTSSAELRRNMALLLRWLHPDMHGDHSLYAARVTRAWNDLKTPERRAAYDEGSAGVSAKEQSRSRRARAGGRTSQQRVRRTVHYPRRSSAVQSALPEPGLLRRALLFLFGRTRTDR